MRRRTFLALSTGICAFGAARIASAQDDKKFKPEELDQMLAPIALYPDALLSQILMASRLSARDRRGGALVEGQPRRSKAMPRSRRSRTRTGIPA